MPGTYGSEKVWRGRKFSTTFQVRRRVLSRCVPEGSLVSSFPGDKVRDDVLVPTSSPSTLVPPCLQGYPLPEIQLIFDRFIVSRYPPFLPRRSVLPVVIVSGRPTFKPPSYLP